MTPVIVTWDPYLIALSYLISVFGSYTALRLAVKIPTASDEELPRWLVSAALALGGCAIWSMHFIAMLAYQVNMPVSYDPFMTAASMVVGILSTALGLYMVGKGNGSLSRLIQAGVCTGLGVAGMHYTGMWAMQMRGRTTWDFTLVGASLVIAIVASCVALWLAFNLRGFWQRIGSALVMGIAVCGMHYTGMIAMKMEHTTHSISHTSAQTGLSAFQLALIIFVISALILTYGLNSLGNKENQQLTFEAQS